jgi:hypothetical protein
VYPQVIESTAFVWQVEGKSPSVEFSEQALAELRAIASRPAAMMELEVGGVLVGSIRGERDALITRVERCEAFSIEHRSGTPYVLSPADRKHLGKRLRALKSRDSGPVGLYRTHARRGMYLDQRDFEIFQSDFSHPGCVFVLVTREGDVGKAGVFIWEDGDVRRHASYREFPLKEPDGGGGQRLAPRPPARTATPNPIPQKEKRGWPAGMRTVLAVAVTVALPVSAYFAGREVARTRYVAPAAAGSTAPKGFTLAARRSGANVEFQWDPQSGEVRHAALGRLTVKDGQTDLQLWLSPDELQLGRYAYVPASQQVEARLDLFSLIDSRTATAGLEKK